ncbi:transcription elongation factor A N-terminal and central domain-containing protein 2-like [Artemia franciscana]|uniref:TFIIS N-terminal domain-containing protein n=1 Tax=Artemia franciscana TaxID=6661 RepID=A0AA88LK15_ARTSF|nr:hypothetical protein QYM36_001297 [Artemia franciscana]KAK2724756.1 hypothetical protein QYM36_001297 [Artemia franciscana]
MDKFVIRLSKPADLNAKSSSSGKKLRQSKIEMLPGVVNVKDFEKYAQILKSSTNSHEILKILDKIEKKVPSTEVLKSTGIGKVVRKLSTHSDLEIASKADDVFEKWKGHVEKMACRKPVEVSSDTATQERREKARNMISKYLDEELGKRIEHEVFNYNNQLLNYKYRKSIRKVALALQSQPDLRETFLKERVKYKEHLKRLFSTSSSDSE